MISSRHQATNQLQVSNYDLQNIIKVMGHTTGKLPNRLHLLRLPESFLVETELLSSLSNFALQIRVQLPQRLLCARPFVELSLCFVHEMRIVNRYGSLCGKSGKPALGALSKDADRSVPEEKAADHFSIARCNRYCQVAAHWKVSLRHSLSRSVLRS